MPVWNIAHRGGAGLRPENTIAAFRHSAALGADGAELDIQLSKDGQVIVFHDYRLNTDICRDGNGRGLSGETPLVKHLTLDELQQFDIGRANPASDYAYSHPEQIAVDGERIPTLGEVIDVAATARRPFRLFVELKTSPKEPLLSASPEHLAEAALDVVRQRGFLNRVIFVGFDWRGLKHLKQIEPNAVCWFSTRQGSDGMARAEYATRSMALQETALADGEGWFPAFKEINAESVSEARRLGLHIGAWTVNDAPTMQRLIALGVDAICTDRPDILETVRSQLLSCGGRQATDVLRPGEC